MKVTLLLILTVLFWGIAPIFDKLAIMRSGAFVGTAARNIIVTAVLLAAVIGSGKTRDLFLIDSKALLYFGLSGVIAGCAGVFTYYKALQLGETSKIVPLAATYPLITAIFSVIFLHESLTTERLIGIILIVSGIWLVK